MLPSSVVCSLLKVDEPTVDETITILKGIQKKYEDYHHVQYTDAAIEAAATLSILPSKIASCLTRPLTS